ncbi:MAG: radical SAM protein [bacterium]|nr:radical SAM protein [bacterium]
MPMKVSTLSVVIGTKACNASCPFCVSRMTGFDVLPGIGGIDTVNFRKACLHAVVGGTTNVLLTGKGEPTLYPDQISRVLDLLEPHGFPYTALQTNALDFGWMARDGQPKQAKRLSVELLQSWRKRGLDTIAISVVSEKPEHNVEVYHKDYPDLVRTVAFLHSLGFTVRLCVMMQKGYVDTPGRVDDILAFCKANSIAQLTVRPIRKPTAQTHDGVVSTYVAERGLDELAERAIAGHIRHRGGKPILTLAFGAEVYDIDGQNCCLSDCLTLDERPEEIRSLIVYANGLVTHSWQHDGAVFLRGTDEALLREEPQQMGRP